MNKAITKRLLSLVLLVVMLVGCALPAYAADTGASGDLTAVYAQEGTSYKDGVYEGTGKGFKNGEIKVKVTITDGKIAKVELVSQEKQSYWETMNVASLFDDIVKANGTEIDGVSGATMSSNGVKAAVNDALSKALVTEPEQPDTGIFAAGTGAKSDPYLIRTVDQIKAFAASVNGGETYASQYVTLDADLDLTGESWTPIGGDSGSFNGIFNGDNHTIAGLTIGTKAEPAAYEYASLFGLVGKGGAIRNLGVKDAFINNKTTDEDPAVAILAAGTGDSSVIDGCWVSGTIISDAAGDNNYTYVGGVVGNNGGKSLVCNTWADRGQGQRYRRGRDRRLDEQRFRGHQLRGVRHDRQLLRRLHDVRRRRHCRLQLRRDLRLLLRRDPAHGRHVRCGRRFRCPHRRHRRRAGVLHGRLPLLVQRRRGADLL